MLFTPEQFIVLGVVLLGGLLIGYACAPSSRKWKRRVHQQSESFTEHYKALEEQLRASKQRALDLESQVDRLRADHPEAERTIGTLHATAMAAPVTAVSAANAPRPALPVVEPKPESVAETPAKPVADTLHAEPLVAPMTPLATDAPPAPIGPAESERPSKGWFASSARDDLTRIRGIDGVLNTRLFSLGVVRFEDLEKLSAEDEMALEQRLALPVGYIAREQWRRQSALLRAGQTEEHAAHFGTEPVLVG